MKIIKKIFIFLIITMLTGIISLVVINEYMINNVKDNIISIEDLDLLNNVDCILVLGCGVDDEGNPSKMLNDRIETGVEAFKNCSTSRIIMSGDHGKDDYDEVNTMKTIAIQNGIDADDIFCDHAGFSTYESMYRANDIFGAKKIIIVTQRYHLTRAIYDAKQLGIEAYGVEADKERYGGQLYRDFREFLARGKDFLWCIFKPEPTYRGEKIPLNLKGSETDG